jgi:hypothetical protein
MRFLSSRFFVSCLFCFTLILSGASANAADKDKEEGDDSGIHFVELQPLILPVIDANGMTQVVSLVVAVEVDSQEKADTVTKYQPRLTDAYLSDLYGAFAHKAPANGIIPITYLKERLNLMSSKVLGDDIVSDVLVQVMQKRPA